jgi:hypothetical protein
MPGMPGSLTGQRLYFGAAIDLTIIRWSLMLRFFVILPVL